MQGRLFQRCTHLLYCSVLSLGGNVNTRLISKPEHGVHLSHRKSMKYSDHSKLLCELSKLSKFNAFIIVYKFRPEITGFNIYSEYKQLQLTFLAL